MVEKQGRIPVSQKSPWINLKIQRNKKKRSKEKVGKNEIIKDYGKLKFEVERFNTGMIETNTINFCYFYIYWNPIQN